MRTRSRRQRRSPSRSPSSSSTPSDSSPETGSSTEPYDGSSTTESPDDSSTDSPTPKKRGKRYGKPTISQIQSAGKNATQVAKEEVLPLTGPESYARWKENLRDVASAYEWPDYILDPLVQPWKKEDYPRETTMQQLLRKQAYLIIKKSISNDHDPKLYDAPVDNPQYIYRIMHAYYRDTSHSRVMTLQSYFSRISMSTLACNIIKFGNTIKKLERALTELGEPTPNYKLVTVYVNGLGDIFRELRYDLRKQLGALDEANSTKGSISTRVPAIPTLKKW